MKRKKPLPRSTKRLTRSPVKRVNAARKAREFARAYGSKARVAWVKTLPCQVCGSTPCENAHTTGDGMGRKAGHATIIPLCALHHRSLHIWGVKTFATEYGNLFDLSALAQAIERKWQSHLREVRDA